VHPEILLQLARSEIHDRLDEAALRGLVASARPQRPARRHGRMPRVFGLLHGFSRRPTPHPLIGPTRG
jgi:hypothetical protein